ncbi:MAG: extensin family protein, partial [Aestuariivirga sp.]
GSFLEAVRSGACKQFATVLGPGSDAYHGDHFHVDAIQRKNDYRICQ